MSNNHVAAGGFQKKFKIFREIIKESWKNLEKPRENIEWSWKNLEESRKDVEES